MSFKKQLSLILAVFITITACPTQGLVWANNTIFMPIPGQKVLPSASKTPIMLKGIKIDPKNPLQFDFILQQSNKSGVIASAAKQSNQEQLKTDANRLIKYFLANLAIPENDLWVNLSPYEKNRMIPDSLGKTELGRDLLAQDYVLKQLTASFLDPQTAIGKEFWNKVYAKSQQQYGTTNIPVDTYNKVWVLADQARIFQKNNAAYILDAHMKIMTDTDYLAERKNSVIASVAKQSFKEIATSPTAPRNDTNAWQTKILKELIIPEIEKEVNTGENFAPLRQMYHAFILASWYKKNLKQSILNQAYADKEKISTLSSPNVLIGDPVATPDYIYQQYLKAFKKGVVNLIQEDRDPITHQSTPRKYFSGGTEFNSDHTQTVAEGDLTVNDKATIAQSNIVVTAGFDAAMKVDDVDWGATKSQPMSWDDAVNKLREYFRHGGDLPRAVFAFSSKNTIAWKIGDKFHSQLAQDAGFEVEDKQYLMVSVDKYGNQIRILPSQVYGPSFTRYYKKEADFYGEERADVRARDFFKRQIYLTAKLLVAADPSIGNMSIVTIADSEAINDFLKNNADWASDSPDGAMTINSPEDYQRKLRELRDYVQQLVASAGIVSEKFDSVGFDHLYINKVTAISAALSFIEQYPKAKDKRFYKDIDKKTEELLELINNLTLNTFIPDNFPKTLEKLEEFAQKIIAGNVDKTKRNHQVIFAEDIQAGKYTPEVHQVFVEFSITIQRLAPLIRQYIKAIAAYNDVEIVDPTSPIPNPAMTSPGSPLLTMFQRDIQIDDLTFNGLIDRRYTHPPTLDNTQEGIDDPDLENKIGAVTAQSTLTEMQEIFDRLWYLRDQYTRRQFNGKVSGAFLTDEALELKVRQLARIWQRHQFDDSFGNFYYWLTYSALQFAVDAGVFIGRGYALMRLSLISDLPNVHQINQYVVNSLSSHLRNIPDHPSERSDLTGNSSLVDIDILLPHVFILIERYLKRADSKDMPIDEDFVLIAMGIDPNIYQNRVFQGKEYSVRLVDYLIKLNKKYPSKVEKLIETILALDTKAKWNEKGFNRPWLIYEKYETRMVVTELTALENLRVGNDELSSWIDPAPYYSDTLSDELRIIRRSTTAIPPQGVDPAMEVFIPMHLDNLESAQLKRFRTVAQGVKDYINSSVHDERSFQDVLGLIKSQSAITGIKGFYSGFMLGYIDEQIGQYRIFAKDWGIEDDQFHPFYLLLAASIYFIQMHAAIGDLNEKEMFTELQKLIDVYNEYQHKHGENSFATVDVPMIIHLALAAYTFNEGILLELSKGFDHIKDGKVKDQMAALDLMLMGVHLQYDIKFEDIDESDHSEAVDFDAMVKTLAYIERRLKDTTISVETAHYFEMAIGKLLYGLSKNQYALRGPIKNKFDSIIVPFAKRLGIDRIKQILVRMKDNDLTSEVQLMGVSEKMNTIFAIFNTTMQHPTDVLLNFWSPESQDELVRFNQKREGLNNSTWIISKDKIRERYDKGIAFWEETLSRDAAMNVKTNVSGGVDFNAKDLQMNVEEGGSVDEFLIDPAMRAQFQSPNFSGVHAYIIRITPINGAAQLLGLEI